MSNRRTFSLTFRGYPVHFVGSTKASTTSVYDALYFVLTYPLDGQGRPAFTPRIAAAYKTVESAKREVRDTPSLTRYAGQTFIIGPVPPGVTEVTDSEVVAA